ncbi:transcriptional regulator domain-containing protein [Sphingomonas sp. PL20]|uniref:transcriptional regulator domain-containing protein n=1 Tax=Sphingomonas sp. PL20 TaxID=2760712 RepID=UPI001039EC0B
MAGEDKVDRSARRNLDFAGFAQEFLRRNPAYRQDYQALAHDLSTSAQEVMARRWGLCFSLFAGRRPG